MRWCWWTVGQKPCISIHQTSLFFWHVKPINTCRIMLSFLGPCQFHFPRTGLKGTHRIAETWYAQAIKLKKREVEIQCEHIILSLGITKFSQITLDFQIKKIKRLIGDFYPCYLVHICQNAFKPSKTFRCAEKSFLIFDLGGNLSPFIVFKKKRKEKLAWLWIVSIIGKRGKKKQ